MKKEIKGSTTSPTENQPMLLQGFSHLATNFENMDLLPIGVHVPRHGCNVVSADASEIAVLAVVGEHVAGGNAAGPGQFLAVEGAGGPGVHGTAVVLGHRRSGEEIVVASLRPGPGLKGED